MTNKSGGNDTGNKSLTIIRGPEPLTKLGCISKEPQTLTGIFSFLCSAGSLSKVNRREHGHNNIDIKHK